MVEDVRLLSDKLNPLHAAKEIELALDRLAQIIQVAMASGVLLWTRENLRTVCSGLPHNNLLQLVISGPVQPSAHSALPPGFYPPIHTPPLGYPAHAAHPVQAFMPGIAFPYRPIR
uniref:Uncharacterized protein n=1 Tax=Micrurus carvalhoi TaxID=3147026 RepID=A0A2H6NGH6_9SAUR